MLKFDNWICQEWCKSHAGLLIDINSLILNTLTIICLSALLPSFGGCTFFINQVNFVHFVKWLLGIKDRLNEIILLTYRIWNFLCLYLIVLLFSQWMKFVYVTLGAPACIAQISGAASDAVMFINFQCNVCSRVESFPVVHYNKHYIRNSEWVSEWVNGFEHSDGGPQKYSDCDLCSLRVWHTVRLRSWSFSVETAQEVRLFYTADAAGIQSESDFTLRLFSYSGQESFECNGKNLTLTSESYQLPWHHLNKQAWWHQTAQETGKGDKATDMDWKRKGGDWKS